MTERYTATIKQERINLQQYDYTVEVECHDYEIFQELVEHIRAFGRSVRND